MLKYFVAFLSVSLAVWTSPEWLTEAFYRRTFTLLKPWLFLPAVDLSTASDRLLSKDELSLYNGKESSKGLYLAILGQVFDVEKGRKHYGPDGGYRFFSGRDASRAFVTGDFSEAALSDDVTDLSPSQIVTLHDWLTFYQKEYTPVVSILASKDLLALTEPLHATGRLIGPFYTEAGEPTDALRRVEAGLKEGLELQAQAEEENRAYPACNSEWSSTGGGRVWCSVKSGGVHRDWAGVPRQLFSPGSGRTRCVCVRMDDQTRSNNPNLQEYEGCPPYADSCFLSQD